MSPDPASVAVLGTGAMGRPMAESLVRAGFEVRAWDPEPGRAEEVAGATAVQRAAEAIEAAGVVMTMAPDGPAVERTMFSHHGIADLMAPGALWLQTSTIGPVWAQQLAEWAAHHGLRAVDAPVIGTLPEAASGALYFFATGDERLKPLCRPLFDAMGTRTFWYDQPGDGQRMKLVVNSWILTLIGLVAESLAMTEELGLDPRQFIDVLDGHPTGAELLQAVGPPMLGGELTGGLKLALARKDLELILDAASGVGFEPTLARAALRRIAQAGDVGYGEASAIATYAAIRNEQVPATNLSERKGL